MQTDCGSFWAYPCHCVAHNFVHHSFVASCVDAQIEKNINKYKIYSRLFSETITTPFIFVLSKLIDKVTQCWRQTE